MRCFVIETIIHTFFRLWEKSGNLTTIIKRLLDNKSNKVEM